MEINKSLTYNINNFLKNKKKCNNCDCCKNIYINYILEQSKELDYLKLEIFWLKYGVDTFKKALQMLNLKKIKCKCINCVISKRYNKNKYINDPNQNPFKCSFKSQFNIYLNKYGLIFYENNSNIISNAKFIHNHINDKFCSDLDVHFENGFRHDWTQWKFGKKLLNANSINDKEIVKYKQFIDHILQIN